MSSRLMDRFLKRAGDAPCGSLFAKPWMTTFALMAVNISLVAVLISSAPTAQAQQLPSLPVCSWCYERQLANGNWVHSTKERRFWRRVDGMTIYHERDGSYSRACWTAHFWAACCDPGKG